MRQPASSDPRKQLVESGYDRIAERYLAWAGGIDDPGRARMLDLLLERLPPGGDVLDLGCGAGVPSTVRLAERHRVTGVDISQEQLRLARERLPHAELVHADLASVEFPDASFDGVTCFYALGHLPREQLGGVFRSVRGWLRPGGWFLTSLACGDNADASGEWLGVANALQRLRPRPQPRAAAARPASASTSTRWCRCTSRRARSRSSG